MTSRIFQTTYCTMLFKIFTFIWTAGATTSVRIFGTEYYFFFLILAKFQTSSSFLFETFSCVRSFFFSVITSSWSSFFLQLFGTRFFLSVDVFLFWLFLFVLFFLFSLLHLTFLFKLLVVFYLLIPFLLLLFLECTSCSFDLVTDKKIC